MNYNIYAEKDYAAETDRGKIANISNSRTRRFWEVVSYIKQNTPEDATLVAFPEGLGINYFAKRDNPLNYHTFIPPHVINIGEDRIISQLQEHKIDYIVILSRKTSVYGSVRFGEDYAQKIASWIYSNYTMIKLFGSLPFTGKDYGMAVYERRKQVLR
jgi:hypothetical protein